jgi:signal transduction histidine kinase
VWVFANLLENAADALAGDGAVTIAGSAQDAWVEVTVADDGPGIPPAQHDRIFEFAGADGGQLGFGLWWVKTWMVRLGGTIAVESDGERGTTFRLRLPRSEGALRGV